MIDSAISMDLIVQRIDKIIISEFLRILGFQMFVSGVMIINLSNIYKTMFLIRYINVLFASYRIIDFDLFKCCALLNIVYKYGPHRSANR